MDRSILWFLPFLLALEVHAQIDLKARRSVRTLEGSGDVFVGDFDEDGNDDLACLESTVLSFFNGNGDGTFDPPVLVHVLDRVRIGMAADMDGDGRLDLVGLRSIAGVHLLVTLLGTGAPDLFDPPVFSTLSPGSGRFALADLDEDGILDAVVPTSEDLHIFLGDVGGGFTQSSTLGTVDNNTPVTADLNGDGHVDLIAPSYSHPTRLYSGRGDGTFDPPVLLDPVLESNTVLPVDLDGNGTIDLVTDDRSRPELVLFSNDGAGNFTSTRITDPGHRGTDVLVAADFDGSGRPDLFALGGHVTSTCGDATVSSLLLDDGQGGFLPPQVEWTVPRPSAIATGDFDDDGNLDAAVSGSDGQSIGIHLGDGLGGLGPFAPTVEIPFLPTHLSPARDWTGDGWADVIVASDFNDGVSSNEIWLYAGTADGTLEPHTLITTDHGAVDFSPGDYDGDGNLDVAMAGRTPKVRIYLGDGTGNFLLHRTFNSTADLLAVEGGDLNEDGDLDVVLYVALLNSAQLRVHLSNGSGGYLPVETHNLGSPTRGQMGLKDLDQDGHLDVITPRGVSYGTGQGDFSGTSPSSAGGDVQFADVNGDSLPDLVTWAFDRIRIEHNHGDRNILLEETHPFPSVMEIEVVDLDGDGALDIVGASDDTYEVMVLRNRGDGTFEPLPHAFGAANIAKVISLTSGEFTRDDRPDVVLVSECARALCLLPNRTANFPDRIERCLQGGVNAGLGNTVSTLMVNGSPGNGPGRMLSLATNDPLTIAMEASPYDAWRGSQSRFAIFLWTRVPREEHLVDLPLQAGCLAFHIPATGTTRLPKRTWNNLLHFPIIGNPDFASTPAPSTVFELLQGTGIPVTFTLQGLIEDEGAPGQFPVSPTNGVLVTVE